MGLQEEIDALNSVVLTAEQEADIDYAIAHAVDPEDEAVAVSASFDVRHRMLLLELKTGQRLAIPQEDVQAIWQADPADVEEVEIVSLGTALHWEKLMDGVRVDSLRRGVYGSVRWMDGLAERRRARLQRAS